MRILILTLLVFNIFQLNAQNIQYKLTERESERNQVRKDQFNIHLKTTIEPDLVWFQAIEPNWTNVAGIIKDGKMNVLFSDSINDGLLRHNYIYENSGANKDYVVVIVRSFDDGPSDMLFFHIREDNSRFLGSLPLFLKQNNSDLMGGYSEIYAKEQMTISKRDGSFELLFLDGFEYIYRNNYEENILNGPVKFELTDKEFELVKE